MAEFFIDAVLVHHARDADSGKLVVGARDRAGNSGHLLLRPEQAEALVIALLHHLHAAGPSRLPVGRGAVPPFGSVPCDAVSPGIDLEHGPFLAMDVGAVRLGFRLPAQQLRQIAEAILKDIPAIEAAAARSRSTQ